MQHDTEAFRERLPEDDPATGWALGIVGLGIGILLGLLACGCLGSVMHWF